MIKTDKVMVKSSVLYKEKGYDIDHKYIIVNIEDVPTGSRVLVTAICDFCNSEKEVTYRDYNDNIRKGNKYACSIKCGSLKAKESNLEKIGVDSHFKLKEFKEKSKKSIIEKWGVDHISKSEEISKLKSKKMKEKSEEVSKRIKDYYQSLSYSEVEKINEKREKTNLKKWGYKYVSQSDIIKEKVKNTNLEKWGGYTLESGLLKRKVLNTNIEKLGVDNPLKSEVVREKIKKTNLEKWGVDNPLKSEVVREKIKKTNLEKWGVDNPFKLQEIKDRIRQRLIDKWGTDSYFKTDDFKSSNKGKLLINDEWRIKNLKISNDISYIRYLDNNFSEFICDGNKDHTFIINSSNYYNRKRMDKGLCTICNPISNLTSISENELFEYIVSIYNGKMIRSYRDGFEIDIYLPELKLGFEFNGLYWHSELYKEDNYHLNKTDYFKKKDIRVIHVWEDDWTFKRDILKSQIKNLLLLSNSSKIFARNCDVKEVNDVQVIRKFLNENHIQGYVRSSIKLGLYHNNELVSLMVFDNIEGRHRMEPGGWNLNRFCNKKYHNVVGGASKLLNYFIKTYNPNRIISYADMDWSNGGLYHILNFKLIDVIKPDYKYIFNNKRVNKQSFTKSKLKKLGLDVSLSEKSIMENLGIYKIYNVGKLKFELNFN